ncbi:hypothetical protein [Roseiconus lacunae]|uniref:Uncharacterized protein n=1 Tax=Roseiconus lacunae TaxID=2605694 RepID=A0ABT7PP60_9BACT|nr:hypothetical protein [Roseiconus lacunae]MDM4018298.1 hypothetical protein [Roseiconus lacunae]
MVRFTEAWSSRLVCCVVSVAINLAAGCVSADDSPNARLEYLNHLLERVRVEIEHDGTTLQVKTPTQPILRFGDATRQTSDGVLWAFGEGRPKAMIAMEMVVNSTGQPIVSYEFLCLTDSRLKVRAGEGWVWMPRQSEMQFQMFPKSPSVPKTESLKRRQMKLLATQFSVSEKFEQEDFHLRLMPNPIVHYSIKGSQTESGAVFVFANGTNPEVLLFLETNRGKWQFGLARMCGAAPVALLNNESVWSKPSMGEIGKGWTLPYTGDAHKIDFGMIDRLSNKP